MFASAQHAFLVWAYVLKIPGFEHVCWDGCRLSRTLPLNIVDNSTSPSQVHLEPVFGDEESKEVCFYRSKTAYACFCKHLHQTPRDRALHTYLALVPLKRKSAATDMRAPRAPSIVGRFCLLPSRASVVDTVASAVCLLALVAAPAPRVVIGVEATSVIVGAPPFQMGQQLGSLLRSGSGPSCQSL